MATKADRIHYLDMGPWPCFVGFTTSPKAFDAEMKRLKVPDGPDFLARARANATTHFFFAPDGPLCCIITMAPFKNVSREQYAALLAHEATHVVQQIRRELNRDEALGDEAEAYLVGHIVQHSLQVAWNTGRSKKVIP